MSRGRSLLAVAAVIAAVFAIVAATGLPGVSVKHRSVSPLVTPAQAQRVTRVLWIARERALVHRDVKAFARVETGSARLTDTESANEIACGCGKFYWTQGPRKFIKATLYLPKQDHYPLYFAVGVLAGDKGQMYAKSFAYTAFLIITRRSPAEPWRIAVQLFDVGYNDPSLSFSAPSISVDQDGYENLGDSNPPASTAATWFPKLIAYYKDLKKTGTLPSGTDFLPGPLTTTTGLEQHPNGYVSDGVKHSYAFGPGRYGGPWTISAGKETIVCGDISELATSVPVQSTQVLVQPPSRHGWGPDIAPGLYRKLTTVYEWALCVREGVISKGLAVGGNLGGGYPVQTFGRRLAPLPSTTA